MTTTIARRAESSIRDLEQGISRRAVELLERKIAFIPNASFDLSDDGQDWSMCAGLEAVENGSSGPRVPKVQGLPAHLMRMCETPVLSAAEERACFRRMNHLKFKSNALQSELRTDVATAEQLDELENIIERFDRIRNFIVQANIRLVMSISKKYSDKTNVFDDMLSEGIASLMNAVEKFDFDRGFRFSTYATTSIQRDLYRSVAKTRELSCRFNTGADPVFSVVPAEAAVTNQAEAAEHQAYTSLTKMIEQLDPREKLIILARFGFDSEGGRKTTYTSLSKQLGISKERVRQLAERALVRLRAIAPDFGLAAMDA